MTRVTVTPHEPNTPTFLLDGVAWECVHLGRVWLKAPGYGRPRVPVGDVLWWEPMHEDGDPLRGLRRVAVRESYAQRVGWLKTRAKKLPLLAALGVS